MTERRYNEDEVANIFRAAAETTEGADAAETGTAAPARTDGMTLSELKAIAGEVGISPDAVVRAAQSLDIVPRKEVSRRFIGLPIGVQRTVALDRRLTDEEWELLVVDLRSVFNARGVVRSQGTLREWSNGNLHALLEPTPTGHQLRIGTYRANSRATITAGAIAVAVSAVVAVAGGAGGALAQVAPGVIVPAMMGVALMASGAARLPGWARRRGQQMDGIIDRLLLMTRRKEP